MGKELAIFLGIVFLLVSLVSAFDVSFISPTPASGSVITGTSLLTNSTLLGIPGGSYRTYGGINANRSLVAWWTMDERIGNTIVDKSGRGNNLVLYGNVSQNSEVSRFGSSLYFNTSQTDFAQSPGREVLDKISEKGFTFSFWVYLREETNTGQMIFISNGANLNGFRVSIDSNPTIGDSIVLTLGNGTANTWAASKKFSMETNTWKHVAITYEQEKVTFYLDGQYFSSQELPFNFNIIPSSNNFMNVGNYQPGAQSIRGYLDDILIYERAISSEEVRSLYSITGDNFPHFSQLLYGFPSGPLAMQSFAMGQDGALNFSELRTVEVPHSGPHFLKASYTFENSTNRTSLSAYVNPGFYEGTAYSMDQLEGEAYYRVNNGNWTLISDSTYVSKNLNEFGGLYGDSLTGFGTSSLTWDFDFGPMVNAAFWGSPLKHGIPSTLISQIRNDIALTAPANKIIFLQGGTNDITVGRNDQAIINDYIGIFQDARNRGIKIYLTNIPARNSVYQNQNVTRINNWLQNYYLYNNSDRLILGYSDVYSAFVDPSTGRINAAYANDGLHPNQLGINVWAQTVFDQGYRKKYHNGFYAEFVPVAGTTDATYDLKWTIRNPDGKSSEYQFDDVFTIEGTGEPVTCPTDLDDGTSSGTPDGGVDINDLLFFLNRFEAGSMDADLDDGTLEGTPDGGVDINDLLYFLLHFEEGC